VIDIDAIDSRFIYRAIIAAYLNNFTYVIIRGKKLKTMAKEIKDRIASLIALEIIEETSDKITAKNFLNIHDAELAVLLRRMDNIVRSMLIDSKEAVYNRSIIDSIIDRDREINKLNFLIAKILKAAYQDKSLLSVIGITEKDLIKYWEINGSIEQIGDGIKHMARNIVDMPDSHNNELKKLLEKIERFYTDSMKVFYTDSAAESDHITFQKEDIVKEVTKFSSKKNDACIKIAIIAFTINDHINDIGRIVRYVSTYE
jgi:phosphate uptake regulator